MRLNDELPDNSYYQSYLYKAGIRFDVNVIDSICKKGISWSFIAVFLVLIAISFCAGNLGFSQSIKLVVTIICLAYIAFYLLRLMLCLNIRARLRRDNNPIVVEAYATVILDMQKPLLPSIGKGRKAAVLYKECGTLKPRFFTSAVKPCCGLGFYPEQMARVFINRKRPSIYTIDDATALSTVSKKSRSFVRGKVVNIQNKSAD